MAVSKAQQAAQNKWIAKAYDRINLTVEKGKRDIIKAHAALKDGGSVNAFINRAIDEAMERDCDRTPLVGSQKGTEAPIRVRAVSLPSEALDAAQRASKAVGEAVSDFIARAIETQAQQDETSLHTGINPAAGEKMEGEA